MGTDDSGLSSDGGGGGGKLGGIGYSTVELLTSFECWMSGTKVDNLDILREEFSKVDGDDDDAAAALLLTDGLCMVCEGDIVVMVVICGGLVELLPRSEATVDEEMGKRGSMKVVERELWSTKNTLLPISDFISQPGGNGSLFWLNKLRNLTSSLLC